MNFAAALNPLLLLPAGGLSVISLFLLLSTAPSLFWTQASFVIAGIIAYVIFSMIDYRLWGKLTWLLYIFSLIALSTSFLGPSIRGSTRWIDFGFFQLQPSEFVKPFMIMIFAFLFTEKRPYNLTSIAKPLLLLLPMVFLIFKQPDLGNVIVYLTVFLALLIAAGMPWRYLIVSSLIFFTSLPLVWHILHDYQRHRIIAFLSPDADPAGIGYNGIQAMISIGSGQLFGLGLGRGTQSRLSFLPEYHTDFVFASLGEELGFIGGIVVIVFFSILFAKLLRTAAAVEDEFGQFLLIGLFMQFFIQAFINIGMNLGILPITGITLPLVSYGGSSILSTWMGLGLAASVAKARKNAPLVIR